jgi:nitrogen fixation protein NifU and related proteins
LAAHALDLTLHFGDHPGAFVLSAYERGDHGDVGVNVGERSWRECEEADASFQYLCYGLFLVGNCCNDQVRFGGEDFMGLCGPGVGDDPPLVIEHLGNDVGAIFGAGDYPIECADCGENHGCARLQTGNAPRCVLGGHCFHSRGRTLGGYLRLAPQNNGREPGAHYNGRVYSQELLDHFQNPRNAGDVVNPDASAQLDNPACGDVLKLSLKLEGDRIAEIRFRAKGCVPAMACGSAITELAKGKSIAEARRLDREALLQEVGGVPEASHHATHLALDTLMALLRGL